MIIPFKNMMSNSKEPGPICNDRCDVCDMFERAEDDNIEECVTADKRYTEFIEYTANILYVKKMHMVEVVLCSDKPVTDHFKMHGYSVGNALWCID